MSIINVPTGSKLTDAFGGAAVDDTLSIKSGYYSLANFNRSKNLKVVAADGPGTVTITAAGSDPAIRPTKDVRLEFYGVTFDGPGFDAGVAAWSLVMSRCRAINFSRGGNPGSAQFTKSSGHGGGFVMVDSSITDCDFDDPNGWAIGGWYMLRCFILYNRFHCANALKFDAFQNVHDTVVCNQNDFDGVSRMPWEWQGRGKNIWFQDNLMRNFRFPGGTNYQGNINTFNSMVLHGAEQENIHFNRNVMAGMVAGKAGEIPIFDKDHSKARPDGTGTRLMFEAGNGMDISDNWAECCGTFTSVPMLDDSRPTFDCKPTIIKDNLLEDAKYGQGSAYGTYANLCQYVNNNKDVKVTFKKDRPIPGPGVRYEKIAGALGDNRAPAPNQGVIVITDPPNMLTLNAKPFIPTTRTPNLMQEGAFVDFFVGGITADVKFVRFEPQATGDKSVAPRAGFNRVVPATGSTLGVRVQLGRPAWNLNFRAVPLDAQQKEIPGASAFVTGGTMEGTNGVDSADPFPRVVIDAPPVGVKSVTTTINFTDGTKRESTVTL